MRVRKDRTDDAAAPSRREDARQRQKEVRNGRQRQEGQGQGPETENEEAGTEGKKEAGEGTEKNPLTERLSARRTWEER
jgi:hypothetical protein